MASPVTEAARRIFADFADPQAVNRDAAGAWKAPLWGALEEAGPTLAGGHAAAGGEWRARRWRGLGEATPPLPGVPEAGGGAGGSLAEGFEVLAAAGRH